MNEFVVNADSSAVVNGTEVLSENTGSLQPVATAHSSSNIAGRASLSRGDVRVLTRLSKTEYVKCVVSGGRVVGCMLVGETDLEETMENIMLSQINVDALGFDLLDDEIDIEDFFD